MNKTVLEIYEKIVNAKIGEQIGTKTGKGQFLGQTVEQLLRDQGYTWKTDYDTVFDWGTANTFIKKLAEIQPYKAPVHDFKIGDIVQNSWGWEQTNIDFYQVVAVTSKTISIREIMDNDTDFNAMQLTGQKKAIPDCFHDEKILKKTPYFHSGEWWINFKYGAGRRWNGKPVDFSCYA